jgi:hypothetical protein
VAFGIGRIVRAVELLSGQITGTRTELNAAITQTGADLGTALNDIRSTSEANSRDIAAVRRELAELQALVQCGCTETAETGTETGTEPVPGLFDHHPHPGDDQPHHDLLAHAAGVSNAELVCHADIWAFITEQASRGEHFRMPVDLAFNNADSTVQVKFSGRTLIAIADALWEVTQSPTVPASTHHLAAQTYNRIHGALAHTGPAESGSVVRIVIDDRMPLERDDTTTLGTLRFDCATN